jgi:hypothetical protein
MKMQVHKKPFQKRFQCIVHLFRRRNGLKNVNTYWLIWEEKNSWIDDKRKRMWKFLTLQTNPLGTIPLFCRKTEIGGARPGRKFAKMYFNLQKAWWFGVFGKSLSRS